MKLQAGITKFKASTIAEVEMTAEAGGRDILLAIQPVGPQIRRLVELVEKFPLARISAIVDDKSIVEKISAEALRKRRVIPLYIDLNVGMNRTGVIPGQDAIKLYRFIAECDGVEAAGLHAYDGHLHEADIEVLKRKLKEAFEPVWAMCKQFEIEQLPVPNIIAGGTPTSRFLAEIPGVEVGAGTIALWDSGQPDLSPDLDFDNALVILARVISHPTSDRICLDVGHKAIASEMAQPRAHWFGLEDARIVMHSEEHMVLETDRSGQFPVGTEVYGLPRHVCPTVALHHDVWCVRDGVAIEKWPVTARSRTLTV